MKFIPDVVGWWDSLEHPFRHVSRWAAALILAITVGLCVWSPIAEYQYGHHAAAVNRARLKQGDRRDFDLYETINRRVAHGENYWHAALSEQRKSRYPTKPFVAVRLPTLAWATAVLGPLGWRVIAIGLWLVTVLGMLPLLSRRAIWPERFAAAVGAGVFGTVAWMAQVGLSHEILAGAFLSASLVVYRPQRWWPALLLAACALAIRELALPFVLLWAAFAASQRRWREFAAVMAVVALFALGMWFHSQAVLAERLPGDLKSPGWTGMQGLPFTLYGLMSVTPLGKNVWWWLGPPLLLLPLLGWLALGGRTGLFAFLWFGGFLLAASLFARQENFYWMSLVIPAYGAGLAFVPRGVYDLTRALRRPRRAAGGDFQAA